MTAAPLRYASSSDQVRIAYSEVGKGPLLLMCDGPFLPLAGGWELGPASRLTQRLRVVRFDHRRTGASERTQRPVRIEDQVRDLETVIDAVTDQPVTLLGYSHGSHAALAFAAQQPRRVSRLVVYGSPSLFQTKRSNDQQIYDQAFDALCQQAFTGNLFAKRAFAMAFIPTAGSPAIDRLAKQFSDHLDAATLLAFNDASRSSSVEELLPAVTVAMQVFHRRDDPLEFVEGGRQIASMIPHAEIRTLAGNDHLLLDGHPELEEFAVVVEEFVLGAGSHFPDGLTAREVEVLRLLSGGLRNLDIANALVISPATVTRHVSNILAKTGFSNRTELSRYAFRQGLSE